MMKKIFNGFLRWRGSSCFRGARRYFLGAAAVLLFFSGACFAQDLWEVSVSQDDFELIGRKIFYNEAGGNPDLIACWNEGEDFLSLGLGHFIWYQKGKEKGFKESFPDFLYFLRLRGEEIPKWLVKMGHDGYPWKSREEFMNNMYPEELAGLRSFLNRTKTLQIMFIFNRLNRALPLMMTAEPKVSHNVEFQFRRLVSTPGGIYALVDYVNFKGEGILDSESYKGHHWGLLQVLKSMRGKDKGLAALKEFSARAMRLLKIRVRNAPPGVDEEKWIPIWGRRLKTYVDSYETFKNSAAFR